MPLTMQNYMDWESQVAREDVSKLVELLENPKQSPIKAPSETPVGRWSRAVVRNASADGA